jgi:nicotinamide riboside transporter PnuC
MVCFRCGCGQVLGAIYCRQCGARLGAPVQPPVLHAWREPGSSQPVGEGRVAPNLQPLGIMWCLFGALRLAIGFTAATALRTLSNAGIFDDAPMFVMHSVRAMVPAIAMFSLIAGVASIVLGVALLARKPWARILGIVVGILSLVKIPVGTALGIYTLWVLAPAASGSEWERLAATHG